MYKLCISHGRGTTPKSCWIPDIKEQLEKKDDIVVYTPKFKFIPTVEDTIAILHKTIGIPDENTFLVGHSNGALGNIVYLDWLVKTFGTDFKLGGMYLVSPFYRVNKKAVKIATYRKLSIFPNFIKSYIFNQHISKNCDSWSNTSIKWDNILKVSQNNVCFFSNKDPFVDDNQFGLFEDKLNPEIHIIKNAGHFTSGDGYNEFPQLVERIFKDLK